MPATARSRAQRTRPVGRRLAGVAAALAAAAALGTATAAPAAAALPNPSFPVTIDAYAPYEAESTCSPIVKPGIVALRDQILRPEFAGALSDYGTTRSCSSSSSGHEEGRAVDWMMDYRLAAERANGQAFIDWLLATDGHGNKHAMARRLGVMYVIWNDKIWSASRAAEGWRPYVHASCRTMPLSSCSATLRHIDHVHLSLSWDGANKRTSYWTAATTPAPTAPIKPAPAALPGALPGSLGAFPGKQYFDVGDRNDAVLRYERRLAAAGFLGAEHVNGYFSANTVAATKALEKRAGITVNGIVGPDTWAAADRAR